MSRKNNPLSLSSTFLIAASCPDVGLDTVPEKDKRTCLSDHHEPVAFPDETGWIGVDGVMTCFPIKQCDEKGGARLCFPEFDGRTNTVDDIVA